MPPNRKREQLLERLREQLRNRALNVYFNAMLVTFGGRRAYLHEMSDYNPKITALLKKAFPNLHYTPEAYTDDGEMFRFFVTREELSETKFNDKRIAQLLDFDCRGIPSSRKMRYILHYDVAVDDQSAPVNFYSAICPDHTDFHRMTERYLEFQRVAKMLGMVVRMRIDQSVPLGKIDDILENFDYWNANTKDFHGELEGRGILVFAGSSEPLSSLLEHKRRHLAIALTLVNHDPLEKLYPITQDQAKTLEQCLDHQAFDADPVEEFTKYLDCAVELLSNKPDIDQVKDHAIPYFWKKYVQNNKKLKAF